MKDMNEKELRELDAWIAEYVMGFKWTAHKNPVEPFINKRWLLDKTTHDELVSCGGWIAATMNEEVLDNIPGSSTLNFIGYTTDKGGAMEVLKKCVDKISATRFDIALTRDKGGSEFIVTLDSTNDKDVQILINSCVNAETLELAICKFAKKLFRK